MTTSNLLDLFSVSYYSLGYHLLKIFQPFSLVGFHQILIWYIFHLRIIWAFKELCYHDGFSFTWKYNKLKNVLLLRKSQDIDEVFTTATSHERNRPNSMSISSGFTTCLPEAQCLTYSHIPKVHKEGKFQTCCSSPKTWQTYNKVSRTKYIKDFKGWWFTPRKLVGIQIFPIYMVQKLR